MRPGKGCASCRERHLKCITEPGNPKCTRCTEAARECIFGPKYRFRQVSHVDDGQGDRARQELSYAKEQQWVSTRKHFSFILEDGSGLEYGVPDDEPKESSVEPEQAAATIDLPRRAPISGLLSPVLAEKTQKRHGAASVESMLIHDAVDDYAAAQSSVPYTEPSTHSMDTPGAGLGSAGTFQDFSSPASIDELTRRHEDAMTVTSPGFTALLPASSTECTSPVSLLTPSSATKPNLSRREAYLIQHFINKVGPWLDVCDLANSFTHELPRRAMQKPMVLYAILALTSRHLATLAAQPEPAEASFYHGQCLRLVIDQLAGPESSYDDNLLSTIVCLRVYEEIEHAHDGQLHLDGTGRLLRAIPRFAHSGGLGEAACWQALRQDIYISLARSVAPSFQLELFDQSSAFTFKDDGACANIVVLLFAKILRLAFSTEDCVTNAAWDQLKHDLECWNDRRLRLFQPIYYEDMDFAENRPFPIIHMISPPQVAALQYYHCSKIFFLMSIPDAELLTGFAAAKRRRTLERDVASHLAAIIGLARSNPFVENANFTAMHMLRAAGYCIINSFQRECVLEFLQQVQRVMGWSTAHSIALLKEQWSTLDSPID